MASHADRRRQLGVQLAALYRYRRDLPPHHGDDRGSVDERIRALEAEQRALEMNDRDADSKHSSPAVPRNRDGSKRSVER